jgi:hypothetical protein
LQALRARLDKTCASKLSMPDLPLNNDGSYLKATCIPVSNDGMNIGKLGDTSAGEGASFRTQVGHYT